MEAKRTGKNPVSLNEDGGYSPDVVLRYQRMARELRLTDQILSFDVDSVGITDDRSGAPAWTTPDGAAITINAGMMPKLSSRRDIAVWLGTNAHELFHNLFTPRQDSLLMRRVAAANKSSDPGIHRTWNLVEDQRIERLGLARFGAWRGYLVSALAHHISPSHDGAWMLLAGRTWLPGEVRAKARAAFVATNDESAAKEVAQLIGVYQSLLDPGEADADEAWRVVYQLHSMFASQQPPGGCGGSVMSGGEPELDDPADAPSPTADEADAAPSPTDEADGDDADADDGDGDGDDDDADDGDGDGDGDDADDGDGDGDGADDGEADGSGDGDGETDGDSGSDDSDDGSGSSDTSGEGDPGDGVSGPDGADGSTETSIDEAFDQAIDEALGDDETSADLDRVEENLDHGASGGGDLPPSVGQWSEATNTARTLSRDVADVLRDIKDDCEAAWVRRTDSGRFSVDRWATDPDWDADNVFDLFDPGAMDASALDVTLVLDVSGSMQSEIGRLAEATWAIRQAVDLVEGECNCIAFGTSSSMMFPRGKRPDGRMFVPNLEGSTNPTPALREAHRLVAESEATNRLVITLTDGQWWNEAGAADYVKAINDAGAMTSVVGLGRIASQYVTPGFSGAQHTASIKKPGELVEVFRTLAESLMRQAAGV